MSRRILALLIMFSLCRRAWTSPADDPRELLARAEALYYQADFAKSIELLLRADELLQKETGHLEEKTGVKLQLALGFIGLNDNTRAKGYLLDLYAIDADHRIDPQLFAPKVIQLAESARLEQNELRCRALLQEGQRRLAAAKPDAVVEVIGPNEKKCAGLAALYPKTAELFFKEGLDAYRKAAIEEALQKFRNAVRFEPKHELAAEYLSLAESKLEVAADRALLAWRKHFSAGDLASAARDYRELLSRSSAETIAEMRNEYRRALSGLVDSWQRACAQDDVSTMQELRLRVETLLPEPSFAEDILAKMTTCTHATCLQMNAQLALARLKNRTDPQFSAFVVSQLKASPVTVLVKARINEKGEVVSSEARDGNPLLHSGVKAAFDQWKFSPAILQGESRCVDTEIPIVITLK
jgi:hypothetical protein